LENFKISQENHNNENDLKIFYRYTQTQGRQWTEWVPLTADNLKASRSY
jgi:hypothetical protein